ncbi:pyridoxamine 5'-phosphate oxidase family protein [Oculatella sp. LEGE 06141]|uniref:pyridoxamine 5'-phosphate oxidase family protein n=1 Tax=Oculatella sp. LEGE 06141 TaxID=1828648 RepID=UPI00187F1204|nr:pyridoxamine 5'-phosphate oxidase family protein [Oculatella sp. LEGE 06141]MBE9178557.1 pyridoxamine 5'-phosphate oxidase family protein [Oculatella sp. LEGE 06141]
MTLQPETNSTSLDENPDQLPITPRTQVKRVAQRGHYERDLIYQILDEGLVCHVGFAIENQPFVIPTAYGRVADRLYIHGSPASRMLRSLQKGIDVCVTVTLLDGLVLARSAFHHSMNYRSVVVFGTATTVQNPEQKLEALRAFTEQVVPQRWDEVRHPNRQELAGTLVLSLPLTEASAKVRMGPPVDDEDDYSLPVWAGVLPLHLKAGEAIADPQLPPTIATPSYVQHYARPYGDAIA